MYSIIISNLIKIVKILVIKKQINLTKNHLIKKYFKSTITFLLKSVKTSNLSKNETNSRSIKLSSKTNK